MQEITYYVYDSSAYNNCEIRLASWCLNVLHQLTIYHLSIHPAIYVYVISIHPTLQYNHIQQPSKLFIIDHVCSGVASRRHCIVAPNSRAPAA